MQGSDPKGGMLMLYQIFQSPHTKLPHQLEWEADLDKKISDKD